MIRQKRGLFTFICSLLPGAGEMYMGFFKQGISIMLLSMAIVAFSNIPGLGSLLPLAIVVWFYSFFHVHNLASMPPELFETVEDHFLFTENDEQLQKAMQSQKARKVLAIALIVVGGASLWNAFSNFLYNIMPIYTTDAVSSFTRSVPQCLIAILLIYLGVILIKGKKKELDEMQEDTSEAVHNIVEPEIVEGKIVEETIVEETMREEGADEGVKS